MDSMISVCLCFINLCRQQIVCLLISLLFALFVSSCGFLPYSGRFHSKAKLLCHWSIHISAGGHLLLGFCLCWYLQPRSLASALHATTSESHLHILNLFEHLHVRPQASPKFAASGCYSCRSGSALPHAKYEHSCQSPEKTQWHACTATSAGRTTIQKMVSKSLFLFRTKH